MALWYNSNELWLQHSSGGSDMYKLRRKLLSQNFLHSRKLVSKLLGNSSIGKSDLVLEIGPGKGIITEQLSQKSQLLIGIELDNHWYKYLYEKFEHQSNVLLYNQDFLNFSLPSLPYKVFANVPFAIEGKIVRKLIDDRYPPEDCYLILMRELAVRLEARQKDNFFSICHKPWFDFSIPYYFERSDFTPHPNVDAVLFRFVKKHQPLLPIKEKQYYQKFIERSFGHGQAVYQNLKIYTDRTILDHAFQKLSLNRKIKPGHLSLSQWIRLYQLVARVG